VHVGALQPDALAERERRLADWLAFDADADREGDPQQHEHEHRAEERDERHQPASTNALRPRPVRRWRGARGTNRRTKPAFDFSPTKRTSRRAARSLS